MFNQNQEAGPEREWARLGDEQQELQVEKQYMITIIFGDRHTYQKICC